MKQFIFIIILLAIFSHSLLYGNSDETRIFSEKKLIISNSSINSKLEINDIDKDGDIDIIVQEGKNIDWYKNIGDNTNFNWLVQNITDSCTSADALHLADIDKDGDMDLLSHCDDDIILIMNRISSGTFLEVSSTITNDSKVVDLDPIHTTIRVGMLVIGSGIPEKTRVTAVTKESTYPWYVKQVTLDNSATTSGTVTLSFKDYNFYQRELLNYDSSIDHILTGDMNNDGTLDVIYDGYSYSEQIYVKWLKNIGEAGSYIGNVTWTKKTVNTNIGSLYDNRNFALGDINADGYLDVIHTLGPIIGCSSGDVFWHKHNGNSTSPSWSKFKIGDLRCAGRVIGTGDFDKDGDLDIITYGVNVNNWETGIYRFKNPGGSGDENTWDRKLLFENDYLKSISINDIDKDGKLDIVQASSEFWNQPTLSWFQNNSEDDIMFNSVKVIESIKSSDNLEIIDMDNDGDLDICTRQNTDIVWYENQLAYKPTDISLNLTSDKFNENIPENTFLGKLTTLDRGASEYQATDSHTYTLSNSNDNYLFKISTDSLFVNGEFDYETKDSLTFNIKTTDSKGLSFSKLFYIKLIDVNEKPKITNLTNTYDWQPHNCIFSFDENKSELTSISVSDPENASITYSIGGVDSALVEFIDSSSTISFISPPDFETGKRDIKLYFIATDPGLLADSQKVTVYIQDVEENPIINFIGTDSTSIDISNIDSTFIININEHIPFERELISKDEDSGSELNYNLLGTDKDNFTLVTVHHDQNNYKAILAFKDECNGAISCPDYETPMDSNMDNKYDIIIRIMDEQSLSDSLQIIIDVSNIEDIIGCSDPTACNYNIEATSIDNNNCSYPYDQDGPIIQTAPGSNNWDCFGNCLEEYDSCGACGGNGSWEDFIYGECETCGDIDACNYSQEGICYFYSDCSENCGGGDWSCGEYIDNSLLGAWTLENAWVWDNDHCEGEEKDDPKIASLPSELIFSDDGTGVYKYILEQECIVDTDCSNQNQDIYDVFCEKDHCVQSMNITWGMPYENLGMKNLCIYNDLYNSWCRPYYTDDNSPNNNEKFLTFRETTPDSCWMESWKSQGGLSYNNFILPNEFSLQNIYPNPFNPKTTISYEIPTISDLYIQIYNVSGKHIEVLYEGIQFPGYYEIQWDARGYTSGVYFVKMIAGEYVDTQKLMLIK